jgi:hypothetical protein
MVTHNEAPAAAHASQPRAGLPTCRSTLALSRATLTWHIGVGPYGKKSGDSRGFTWAGSHGRSLALSVFDGRGIGGRDVSLPSLLGLGMLVVAGVAALFLVVRWVRARRRRPDINQLVEALSIWRTDAEDDNHVRGAGFAGHDAPAPKAQPGGEPATPSGTLAQETLAQQTPARPPVQETLASPPRQDAPTGARTEEALGNPPGKDASAGIGGHEEWRVLPLPVTASGVEALVNGDRADRETVPDLDEGGARAQAVAPGELHPASPVSMKSASASVAAAEERARAIAAATRAAATYHAAGSRISSKGTTHDDPDDPGPAEVAAT